MNTDEKTPHLGQIAVTCYAASESLHYGQQWIRQSTTAGLVTVVRFPSGMIRVLVDDLADMQGELEWPLLSHVDQRRLYRAGEVARALDCSTRTVYRQVAGGWLPVVQASKGGQILIRGSDLVSFLMSCRIPATRKWQAQGVTA